MANKFLQFQQLDRKIIGFSESQKIPVPSIGWLKTVRQALGISPEQVAKKLSLTRQGVQDIERREKEGSITVNSLRAAANALDMQLVYGLVPKDGSLDELIDRKARALAKEIVLRTSNTMKLEDQENSLERIEKAIEERMNVLKQEMPKALWD